jgi:putative membrane protein
MIAGHEHSLALYRAQAQAGEDKDLRKFARDTLPTIEHHLAELKSVQK